MAGVRVYRFLAMEDGVVFLTVDRQYAGQAFFSTRKGMIDDGVAPRHIYLELEHRCAAGRNEGSLQVRLGCIAQTEVDAVEDLADHMEAGCQVGAAHAEEDAH